MISKVVSGGQGGSDQGALLGARDAGVPTGGWAPKNWSTERGPAPWLADFGLLECPQEGYPARTGMNVRDSDGTLIFGWPFSNGCECTRRYCMLMKKPLLIVNWPFLREMTLDVSAVRVWAKFNDVEVLNVAGNRESRRAGIQEACRAFVREVVGG